MLADIAIPMLPCRSLDVTRQFYNRLGFEQVHIKFGEDRYLILVRRSIELHFFLMPELAPTTSMHSSYIRVLDADAAQSPNDAGDLSLRGLIDALSRRRRDDPAAAGRRRPALLQPRERDAAG